MTKLADFFTSIGFKVDDASFKKVQSQLEQLKSLAQGINGKFSVAGGRAAQAMPKEQLQAIREDVKRQKAVAREVKEQRQVAAAVKQQKEHNAHIIAYQKQASKEQARQQSQKLSEIRQVEREQKASIRRTEDFARKQQLLRSRQQHTQEMIQLRHANQMEKIAARGSDVRGGMFTGGIAGFTAGQIKTAAAGFGAFELGRGVFDIGTTMTGLRSAFTMMTGSAEGAEEQIAFINKEVDRLSLNFQSAAQDYKQLLASAQSRIGVENTQDLFSAMSEVGLVLGLTTDQQQRSIRAFSQMASKGKVMSEELTGQLAESLPGAVEIFAKALNVPTEELRKMMEDGKALSADVLPKVAKYMKTMTTEEARALAKNSPARRFEQMRTAYSRFLDKIGEVGGYDLLTNLFTVLTKLLKAIEPYIDNVANAFKVLFGILKLGYDIVMNIVDAMFSGDVGLQAMTTAALGFGAALMTTLVPALTAVLRRFLVIPLLVGGAILIFDDLLKSLKGNASHLEEWGSNDGFLAMIARWALYAGHTISFVGKAVIGLGAAIAKAVTGDFSGAMESLEFIGESYKVFAEDIGRIWNAPEMRANAQNIFANGMRTGFATPLATAGVPIRQQPLNPNTLATFSPQTGAVQVNITTSQPIDQNFVETQLKPVVNNAMMDMLTNAMPTVAVPGA